MKLFGIVVTLVLFFIFYSLRKNIFFSKVPIIVSVGLTVIFILKFFNFDYDLYYASAKYLTYIIAPATIAFAYPLYENRQILLRNKRALYFGLVIGTVVAVVSTYICAALCQAQFRVILSMLPKSTTMPIAIEISKSIGGYLELTACVVVATGVLGGVFGHWVLKKSGVKNDVAIGLAMGSASHVIGTAACAEKQETKQVAASTIALILVGLFSAIFIPLFGNILKLF